MSAIARPFIFPGCSHPLPDARALARTFPEARLVDYAAPGGPALRGLLAKCGRPDARLAVFFHGNGDSAGLYVDVAQGLVRQGVDCFLAEYRGYGGCPGSPTEAGLYEDGEAAVAAAGAAPGRLVIAGHSLGTGVATELAARGHGSALILLSPFTSIMDVGRRFAGPLADVFVSDRFASIEKIARVNVEIAVIHGTHDGVVPFALGERLAAATPRARLIPLPGVGHNDFGDLAAVIVRGLADIDRRVGARTTT